MSFENYTVPDHIIELMKVAWGEDGHKKLTNQTAKGLGMKPNSSGSRIMKEYSSSIADGQAGGGRLRSAAKNLQQKGGFMNNMGARVANAGAAMGTMADIPIRHPASPLAQSRHAFPGTLDKARNIIRTGRESAGQGIADAAMSKGMKRNQLFTQAMGRAGESAHVAQDVKPHMVTAGRFADEAEKGMHGTKLQRGAAVAKKLPKPLQPMARSGIGHAASGLDGPMTAKLDAVESITPRDMRNAQLHGKKIRIKAVEALRYQHGVPTQKAVQMVDELLATNPSLVEEVAGKAIHRGKSYAKPFRSLGGKLLKALG